MWIKWSDDIPPLSTFPMNFHINCLKLTRLKLYLSLCSAFLKCWDDSLLWVCEIHREEEWTENQIMTVNSFLSDAIKHKTYLWAWNTCACTMLNANKHELTTREIWNECCDSEITRHNHISSMMATAEEERENSHNFKFSPWKKKTTLTDELTKI